MEGILCIDKPTEHTSFDVVARMRGITHTKKIGHSGTLDPMATGVLPLFFGRAAKACDILPDQDKRYTATFRLGVTTDTQDCTGTVLQRRPVSADAAQVRAALARFCGLQKQLPPMYSAVKVGGRRLYDLARQGKEIERPAREITVYRLELLEADESAHRYTIDIRCSKGTYVRTICHDLGEQLGCGATLTALRRTEACGFTLQQCITIDRAAQLQQENLLARHMLPVETAFSTLPRLVLTAVQARHFQNGVALSPGQFPGQPTDQVVAVYRQDRTFFGIAAPGEDGRLRQLKLFYLGE